MTVSPGSDSSGKKSGDSDQVYVDLTQAGPDEVDTSQIDTGVTSGADPSEWDSISVDSGDQLNPCVAEDVPKSSDKPAPAVCQSDQSKSQAPSKQP